MALHLPNTAAGRRQAARYADQAPTPRQPPPVPVQAALPLPDAPPPAAAPPDGMLLWLCEPKRDWAANVVAAAACYADRFGCAPTAIWLPPGSPAPPPGCLLAWRERSWITSGTFQIGVPRG